MRTLSNPSRPVSGPGSRRGSRPGSQCGRRAAAALAWLAAACVASAPLAAQEDLEKPPPIPPGYEGDVPIPPKVQGEQIEPTVTIRDEEDRRVEEYSFNGRVYMVRITPEGGVPYYYIDTDGDGQLELDVSRQHLGPVQPAQWKIKEWD